MLPLERDLKLGRPGTIDTDKPVLVVLVGLPRSGKSTWARESGLPIVNPDSVRLALHGKPFLIDAEPWVWACVKTMIKSLFLAGHFAVVLDATNTTKKRRADWFNPLWRVAFKQIHATKMECMERAKQTAREDLLPVIDRQADRWEDLSTDEGYQLFELLPEKKNES